MGDSTKGEMLCYTFNLCLIRMSIIIGAGMAGLTCGCLLAQKGTEGPDDREESEGGRLLYLLLRRMDFRLISPCNHWVNVKKAEEYGEF